MSEVKTFPTGLMVTDVQITNYHRAYSSESMSGIVYAHDSGIQWYKGTITLKAYGFENIKRLNGFLASIKGRYHAFELPLGGAYGYSDLAANPRLSGEHNKGRSTVFLIQNQSNLSMGSVFTLPNDTKLYTLLEDVDGDGTYSIVPSLKKSQANLAEANFKNPHITAILDSNETTIRHSEGGLLAEASISWTERIT